MNGTGARILLFTGAGKGKTTAAMGMAMRASGHGMQTLVVQFVKNSETGEGQAAARLGNIKFVQTGCGFVPEPTSEKFKMHQEAARKGLALVAEAIENGEYDLIVLDELCVAVHTKLLEESDVIQTVNRCSSDTTLVMTGRNASEGLVGIADTVTEMRCIKHGLEMGIAAQKGVEF